MTSGSSLVRSISWVVAASSSTISDLRGGDEAESCIAMNSDFTEGNENNGFDVLIRVREEGSPPNYSKQHAEHARCSRAAPKCVRSSDLDPEPFLNPELSWCEPEGVNQRHLWPLNYNLLGPQAIPGLHRPVTH